MTVDRLLTAAKQLLALGTLLLASPALAERTTSYSYTAEGLIASIDGPRTDVADITSYDYDSAGNRIRITNALGHVTEIPEHDAHGNPLRIIDPNGLQTLFAYDARQRLISQSRQTPDGQQATTSYDYDAVGQLIGITLPDGAAIAYVYDAAQRLVAIADALGNRIEYGLDAAGNRTATTVMDAAGTVTAARQQVFNELSELIQSISAGGDITSYTYDAGGNLTATTDALGNTTTHGYDVHQRLIATLDALDGQSDYAHDAADNLSAVTDPNANTTAYSHNAFGEVSAEVSPDRGATAYAYDAAGNLTEHTDARGITVSYSYDALNRRILADYPGTDEDIAYEYDSCANGIGRLCRVTDAAGSSAYAYDARGNLLTHTREQDGLILTLGYAYDLAERLIAITYPSGHILSYEYNSGGQVTGVFLDDDSGSRVVADLIAHLPFGPITGWTWGNGLSASRTFDADYRLVDLLDGPLDRSYGYDAAGNISLLDDLADPASSQQLGYDALYRLIEAVGAYGVLGYGYDPVGNRLSLIEDGDATDYEYARASNRLERILADATQTRTYDAAGNSLSLNGWQLSYGLNGRLTQASAGAATAIYRYDAGGQRVAKTVGAITTHFLYDQSGQLLAELDGAGQTLRAYFYLAGRPLAMLAAEAGGTATERTIDNDQASFSGHWPSSTAIAGFTGADYQVHGANGPSPDARIIDNADSAFSVTGDWPVSSAVPGYLGSGYQVHGADGPSPDGLSLDNTDAAATATGSWNLSTSVPGYLGDNYATHPAGQGANAFSWSLQTLAADSYRLYARWTSHPNRASNATYSIQHSAGTTDVTVDQRHNGGTWQLLDTFALDQNSRVTLTDQADGYVIADALYLEPLDAAPSTATWDLGISEPGDYRLYVRWTSHPNRATDATYQVQHAAGTTDITVDQQHNGGAWQSLGTFALDAGSHVSLTDQADGYVIADALKVEAADAAPSSARWNLAVGPGSYEVLARWTSHPNRATNATYQIQHAAGTTDVTVNQQHNGGTWQSLGTFALDAGSHVSLTDQADGYVIADAIRVIGEPSASAPGLHFIHTDHLDTPQALTNEHGDLAWQARYRPFGAADILVGDVTMPLRFPGQYFDQETGLHYNYFRDYDPATGRYIESDPIGLEGGLNTYAYVGGNPVMADDIFGLAYPIPERFPHGIPDSSGGDANFGFGFGGSGMFMPGYGSADSTIAIGTNGSICYASTVCMGVGANIPVGGELGFVFSGGPGGLCSGRQVTYGVYWAGGSGIAGSGQILSNGALGRGMLGIGGSPEGPMGGAGAIKCVITYICPIEPEDCLCENR